MSNLTYTQILALLLANLEKRILDLKAAQHFIQNKKASEYSNYALEALIKARLYLLKALCVEELGGTQLQDPRAK